MRYIPNSQADRQQMLAEIGIDSTEQLFAGIPEKLRLRRFLDLPKALSEPELDMPPFDASKHEPMLDVDIAPPDEGEG